MDACFQNKPNLPQFVFVFKTVERDRDLGGIRRNGIGFGGCNEIVILLCRGDSGKRIQNSPLKNRISSRLVKSDEMQGVRILRNEAYIE